MLKASGTLSYWQLLKACDLQSPPFLWAPDPYISLAHLTPLIGCLKGSSTYHASSSDQNKIQAKHNKKPGDFPSAADLSRQHLYSSHCTNLTASHPAGSLPPYAPFSTPSERSFISIYFSSPPLPLSSLATGLLLGLPESSLVLLWSVLVLQPERFFSKCKSGSFSPHALSLPH